MIDDTTSTTRRVAAFASGLQADGVPEAVRRHAKLHILDALGCGIAGAASDLATRAFAFLDVEHAPGPCPVLGADRSYGPSAAAFGNAVAMNALDFDDGHEVDGKGMGHPSATLVAAALGAPFAAAVDGSTFLTALVAAYEVNARLIQAIQPSIERFRQVYGVCQHQSIAAAVAYGRQLNLSASAMENAMGFAATFANVPSLRKYNWERRPLVSFKDFNAPAAEAGVRAVQLDACGLEGAHDVLDGEAGFWRMIGSDRFDVEHFVEGIGVEWRLLNGSFKAYPACRWMHTALEAFESLVLDHGFRAEEIESVGLHTSAGLARDFMDDRPTTMIDAQFSMPFALAALAHRVAPASAWYDPATLARQDLRNFGTRVTATIDPEVDAMMSGPSRRPAGRVTVRARGASFESPLLSYPRGTIENPMSDADVEAKFLANATPVVGAGVAVLLMERVMTIEAQGNVADLLRLAPAHPSVAL